VDYEHFRQLEVIQVGKSHLSVLALSPSGRYAAVSSQVVFDVEVYDLDTRTLVGLFRNPEMKILDAMDVAFWPDESAGPRLLIGTPQGLRLVDVRSGQTLQDLDDRPVFRMRWSIDEQVLVLQSSSSEGDKGSVLRFYTCSGDTSLRFLGQLALADRLSAFALSPDHSQLALLSYPAEVKVLGLPGLHLSARFRGPVAGSDLAFSPDGRSLALSGDSLWLVDLDHPQQPLIHREGFRNNLDSVAFSPDGRVVAASAYDGGLRLFGSALSGPEARLLKLLRHAGTANVYRMVFSRDGGRLVSASGDRTLRVWGVPGHR